MPVGAELSSARQQLGLSVEEVAATTKIKIERLSAIEQMDVEGLPTLVYLKGFLRAYAAVVQLDAEEVTKRYLAELPPSYAEREANPPPVPTNGAAKLALEASPVGKAFELDDVPGLELPAMRRAAEHDTPITKHGRPVLPLEWLSALRLSFAPHAPMTIVAVIALTTGWVLGANFSPAHRSPPPAVLQDEGTTENVIAAKDMDQEFAAELAQDRRPARAMVAASVAAHAVDRAVPAVDSTMVTKRSPDATRVGNSIDVSGRWAVTNRLEPAKSGGAKNLGFHVALQQRGNRVSGTGQKWMENGRSIPARSRPLVNVEGTVNGRRLELTFSERGSRSSAGKFVMNVTDERTLRGRFVSNSANARGTSLARRMDAGR